MGALGPIGSEKGVNTCVYIKQLDFNGVKINEDKLKTNYDKPCDITLNITIKPNGSVNIKHVMADNYLKDKVKKWQEEANKRGLKVDVEDLRQQVIKDFESIETEQSFYKKFITGYQKIIGKAVASYVEGIQATQKIGKNIQFIRSIVLLHKKRGLTLATVPTGWVSHSAPH